MKKGALQITIGDGVQLVVDSVAIAEGVQIESITLNPGASITADNIGTVANNTLLPTTYSNNLIFPTSCNEKKAPFNHHHDNNDDHDGSPLIGSTAIIEVC